MEIKEGDEVNVEGQSHVLVSRHAYEGLLRCKEHVETLGLDTETPISLDLLVRLHMAIKNWNHQDTIQSTKIADKTLRAITSGEQKSPYKSPLKKLASEFKEPFIKGLKKLGIFLE